MATAYEPVIGLEVHAQLASKTKLFCGCATTFGAPPNTQVCPVCLGLPGSLPVPNAEAIRLAVRAGKALGCEVRLASQFSRKNYFYPDLSKGYQISQFDQPLNEHGQLDLGDGRIVRIQRAHVEEDAAKNLHGMGSGSDTLVDFNRAGTPLLEIVTCPDLRNAEDAETYLKRLSELLLFIGVNDANLEEGSFRCDANVSIRPVGQEKFGTRVELKNINSFRFVRKAITHEIMRQEAVLVGGGTITQETRTWSEAQGKTLVMRTKEEAHDYRYFPDPDLPELKLTQAFVEEVATALPELPDAKRARWQTELGLTAYDANVLTAHPAIAALLEDTTASLLARAGSELTRAEAGKRVANFIQAEVLGHIKTSGLDAETPVTAAQLAGLLALVANGKISGKIAKEVIAEMREKGGDPEQIVSSKGLAQVADPAAVEAMVRDVLATCPGEVEKYRSGKTNLFGFFVGRVMKAANGTANPALLNDALKRLLDAP